MKTILQNWRTSAMAILPLLLAIMTAFGLISVEQKEAIINGVPVVFDSASVITDNVLIVIELITSIALLFAKDKTQTITNKIIR